MIITVIRLPGDRQGPDIVDALLTNELVGVARGSTELDNFEKTQTIQLNTLYRSGVELGQLVEVHDRYQGKSYRAKIIGIQHQAQNKKVTTQLSVIKYNATS